MNQRSQSWPTWYTVIALAGLATSVMLASDAIGWARLEGIGINLKYDLVFLCLAGSASIWAAAMDLATRSRKRPHPSLLLTLLTLILFAAVVALLITFHPPVPGVIGN